MLASLQLLYLFRGFLCSWRLEPRKLFIFALVHREPSLRLCTFFDHYELGDPIDVAAIAERSACPVILSEESHHELV